MVFTFRKRRNNALELLRTIPGIVTNTPKGAFYIFPNVASYFGKSYKEQLIANATDLSMYLLDAGHVAVVPGDAFGNPNCIRISYATSMDKLMEAMDRIKKALAQLQ
jgi:aspartate aminotransferase